MRVFLVHGWAVRETTTYRALHLKLAEHGYDLEQIWLGRYVTLDNDVELKDIAKAMQRELVRRLGRPPWPRFHVVTHSTGALVLRQWITDYYRAPFTRGRPLGNVVFLAPPHFGSRLAHHGRSMLAHAPYLGDTGRQVLRSLELGSPDCWGCNEPWLDTANWKKKGVRPFCLVGDRIEPNPFAARILPAAYEEGSDMVVRVAAANLNFRRYLLLGSTGRFRRVGGITGVPFAALGDYVHSGARNGIVGSITADADPRKPRWLNLKLILDCLAVKDAAGYARARTRLATVHRRTRKKRRPFAQLDLSFHDETGAPIEDYAFALGAMVRGKPRPSKTVKHLHKNQVDGSHLSVFLDLRHLEPQLDYFMEFNSDSGTDLYRYRPDPLRVSLPGEQLARIIQSDQTTQVQVVLSREPDPKLFGFHRADDPDLHLRWNRRGEVVDRKLPVD